MQSNPEWRVSFSLKHVLLWGVKAVTIPLLTFAMLYNYTVLVFSNPNESLYVWATDVLKMYKESSGIPFSPEVVVLSPVIAFLALLAIAFSVLENFIFTKRSSKPKKKRLIEILVTAGLLVLFVVGFNMIFMLSRQVFWEVTKVLPYVPINITEWMSASSLPADYVAFFSLLVALIYHLVRLCTWNVRHRSKAGAKTTDSAQANEPTPALHTN